jgi:hypothetical protein
MKIFEAIQLLEDDGVILKDKIGNKFQKYSDKYIYITYNNSYQLESGIVGKTISNEEFLKKYVDNSFEREEQWYDKKVKLPILCWVTTREWSKKKLVCLNYRSGNTFLTGYGESYTISHNTKIVPLTNQEIAEFKRGYENV